VGELARGPADTPPGGPILRSARADRLLVVVVPLLLSGCNFAPPYAPPPVEVPVNYKESRKGVVSWQEARPRDDLPRGPWWCALGDHVLNELEEQVDAANPNLAAAVASFDQAQAYSARVASALLPHLDLDNTLTANKQSQHRPRRKANTPFSAAGYFNELLDNRPLNEPDHYGDNKLTLQSSYEIDLWGRVRNAVAASVANSESAAAMLESVRLSLQAELARDYVALRGLDSEIKLLEDTVRAYTQAFALAKTLVNGKIGAPADEPRAQAQLEATRAQLLDVISRRALLEHAIASLIGKPASSFAVAPASLSIFAPKIPPGVPLDLLERRPDIAAVERQVAAANAGIGVAKAAFFPRLMINISAGTEDTGLSLFNFRNSIWTLGPTITLPIFDAGKRAADLAGSEAAYLETAARYRATVLLAYQEVEDALSNLRWLAREQQSMDIAASAAQKVLNISLTLYRDGATNYLDVVIAQTTLLDAQRSVVAIRTRRLEADVALIVALGGGWSVPGAPPLAERAVVQISEPAHDGN
jgi:outer membrane protein, multidrug efflux system